MAMLEQKEESMQVKQLAPYSCTLKQTNKHLCVDFIWHFLATLGEDLWYCCNSGLSGTAVFPCFHRARPSGFLFHFAMIFLPLVLRLLSACYFPRILESAFVPLFPLFHFLAEGH